MVRCFPGWVRVCGVGLAIAIVGLTCGCSLTRYQEQFDQLEQAITLSGVVHSAPSPLIPVIVVLVRKGQGLPEQQRVLEGNGPFSFTCAPGQYYIAAFADANADLAHQPNEWFAWFGKPTLILGEWGNQYDNLDLHLMPPERATGFVPAASAMIPNVLQNHPVEEVVDLEDPRFDPANGRVGIWEPIRFIMADLGGIYFLESFDPDKIPVLFFHGAGSTPRSWAPVVYRLDSKRFQPWLIYYPTAVRLGVMADYYASLIRELHLRYRFSQLHIVGHSMGGLIARAAINRLSTDGGARYVQSLITVSTPWKGHEAAALGVRHSPLVVPSWRDMVSGSSFLEDTLAVPLPKRLRHYLLFSYRSRGLSFAKGNSDGTVSLRSQLDPRAQDAAHRIIGFDEDHVSILGSAILPLRINNILSESSSGRRKKRAKRSVINSTPQISSNKKRR